MALSKTGALGLTFKYKKHARAFRRITGNASLNLARAHVVRFFSAVAANVIVTARRAKRRISRVLAFASGLDAALLHKTAVSVERENVAIEGSVKIESIPVSVTYALGNISRYIPYLYFKLTNTIKLLKPTRTSLIIITALTITVLAARSFFSVGLEVYINNYPVGYVADAQTYNDAAHAAELQAGAQLGRPYALKYEPEYRLAYVRKDQLMDPAVLQNLLFSGVKELRPMYVLSVDNKIIGALPYREGIDEALEAILSGYAGNDANTRVKFAQNVQIDYRTIDITYGTTLETIKNKLNARSGTTVLYTVKKGDTVSQIANANGMTVAQIAQLNPNLDMGRISIGQEITLATTKPLLTVKKTQTIVYNQTVGYKTVYEQSAKLYTYETVTKVKGKEGTSRITADVVYENGRETGRTILETKVLSKPVDMVIVKGTKIPPPEAPTGTFMWPARGNITSRFGPRWGGTHTGLDIANKKGTTVVAADGGVVVSAKYSGSYGNLVIISHGNGVETYYAHNSAFTCKAGDKVRKGQPIAKMGSTGRSTGPHCHFEVRINGVAKNPINYLP